MKVSCLCYTNLLEKRTRTDELILLLVVFQVLREVKVLSSLQHVNVVGYHTAWLEHVQPADREYLRSYLTVTQTALSCDQPHVKLFCFRSRICFACTGITFCS